MKVKPDDADRWAEGMQRMEAEALRVESGNAFDGWPGWGYVLLPRDARWQVRSKPAVFASIDGSAMVAIFKAEGIVMKRIVGF
jgi:hypothetical protein